jgi:hypothetical protein
MGFLSRDSRLVILLGRTASSKQAKRKFNYKVYVLPVRTSSVCCVGYAARQLPAG